MYTNIYYHFFDRELRQSINANLTDSEVTSIIAVSLFLANGICYAPMSNVYESFWDFPKAFELLRYLIELDFVKLASSHSSVENFLYSRRKLYKHDKSRYPMYFSCDEPIWSDKLILLKESTTNYLQNVLTSNAIYIPEMEEKQNFIVNEKVKKIIDRNHDKALTFSLFREHNFHFFKGEEVVKSEIHRAISENYAKRYLGVLNNSHLITGIKQISYYDFLENDRYSTNYYITSNIFKNAGIDLTDQKVINQIIEIKNDKFLFDIIYKKINHFLRALPLAFDTKSFVAYYIRSSKTNRPVYDKESIVFNLIKYIDDVLKTNTILKEEVLKMEERKTIAIVAVTAVEMKSIINAIKAKEKSIYINEIVTNDLVYHEVLGYSERIVIIQSGMGMTGINSIINQLHKVIEKLSPHMILMVGIAFGAKPDKQHIGDILVSNQVWNYEPCKIEGQRRIPRGDKVTASSNLLQLYNSTQLDFEIPVHFGLMASGEKLVNSPDEIENLRNLEPEIIGGDMEAAGVASVCNEKKLDWIVIKAICDWGKDKKDDYQQTAADNASRFLVDGLFKLVVRYFG